MNIGIKLRVCRYRAYGFKAAIAGFKAVTAGFKAVIAAFKAVIAGFKAVIAAFKAVTAGRCLSNVDFTERPSHWLSGKGVRLESGRSGVPFQLESWGLFPCRFIPVTKKLRLQWLPCLALGVTGSALGLVGPVSVYRDPG